MKKAIVPGLAMLLMPLPGLAQEPRFTLQETAGGVMRLDRQTGAMSLCTHEGGNLVCRMAADERAAYEEELARVEKRVAALEERVSHMRPDTVPDEAEIERSLSLMERFLRSFMGIVRDFTGEPEPHPAQPNRT
jgi:hypothetical protein